MGRDADRTDAERFATLDWDECQICKARGPDRRTVILDCLYDVSEVVPEAINLRRVESGDFPRRGFLLRVCKGCRGAMLWALKAWRDVRVALRDRPRDHDGGIEDLDPGRNIPVKVNGTVVMMTREEWDAEGRGELPPSFTCPDCGLTSFGPEDIKYQYCGKCHKFRD